MIKIADQKFWGFLVMTTILKYLVTHWYETCDRSLDISCVINIIISDKSWILHKATKVIHGKDANKKKYMMTVFFRKIWYVKPVANPQVNRYSFIIRTFVVFEPTSICKYFFAQISLNNTSLDLEFNLENYNVHRKKRS